jgi:hypothetical protein
VAKSSASARCPARRGLHGSDNPLADRLMGTQTTLDRIGIQPASGAGGRPGGALLIRRQSGAAGRRGGRADIQAGMLERLTARAAQRGVSNLTTVWGRGAGAFPRTAST